MPKKTPKKDSLAKIDPLALALKKSAEQLWGIFVRRYIARGISELFAAGVIARLTYIRLWQDHWIYWLCIPFPIIMALAIDAIQLLINPHYYAMNDVLDTIKNNKEQKVEVIQKDYSSRW